MRLLQFLWSALLLHLAIADPTTLRAQLGPYPVSITEHEILTNRSDTLAPSPQRRRLMVTIYRPQLDILACPAQNQDIMPYVPKSIADALSKDVTGSGVPAVVDASGWESLRLVNCTRPIPCNETHQNPIVLFSHGLQFSRHIYATSLQAVASSGYNVIAIDHTYDAIAVQFPDGTVANTNIPANASDPATAEQVLGELVQPVRIADAVSVLDAIEKNQIPGLTEYALPLKTVMYGHSLGGSTAAGALAVDSRIIAGMNLDGALVGSVNNLTIKQPFMLLGEQLVVPNWPGFFKSNLKGWKTEAHINNTVHLSFSDGPLIADAVGIRKSLKPNETALFDGAIDSSRNLEISWRYTVAFLDFIFKGRSPSLLEKASAQFPDVRFTGHHGFCENLFG